MTKDLKSEKRKFRLFVALGLTDGAISETRRIRGELELKQLFVGRWTKTENIHLTLKFLGDVDEHQIDMIKKRLRSITFAPFDTYFENLGVFTFHNKIRIIWVKIRGENLMHLQHDVDHALTAIYQPEHRYMGHLTLARVKKVANHDRLINAIHSVAMPVIAFQISEFHLVRSVLSPVGPTYFNIETFGR